MKDIAIYGAGGFGKEVASMILNKINVIEPAWNIVGFFDDGVEAGTEISHLGKCLGGIDVVNNWQTPLSIVFAIGNSAILKKLVTNINNPNIDYPNIIHPNCDFADLESMKMGKGNVVMKNVTFSCDVTIGDFNQFNSLSALAHDVKVGSFNIFMPLTRVSGETLIGNCNFFGINSIILQQIKIGNETRIGANSVLMTKTKDGSLYMGNPAMRVKM